MECNLDYQMVVSIFEDLVALLGYLTDLDSVT